VQARDLDDFVAVLVPEDGRADLPFAVTPH
jgi:hypothetical protein